MVVITRACCTSLFDRHFFDLGFVIFPFSMIAAPVVEASVALGSGSELVVLVFEEDVERGE